MPHVNPIQIQKFLKGVDYPASKATLIDKAKSEGADENVCQSLAMLPDEDFQTPADVSQAFGRLPDAVSGGAPGHEAKGKERPEEKREARHEAKPKEPEAEPRHEAKREPRHTGSNEFLIEAIQDSMAEIQICEMAIEKSDNPDVKAFAQSMIDEHGRMGKELEKLASDKKLKVPRDIRREQQMTVDELSAVQGRDFEQRWIQYEIDVHERDAKVFSHYAQAQDDADIRKMAEAGAKRFGAHLKMAHDVGKKLARA
jgi:predicted outer membrane protein